MDHVLINKCTDGWLDKRMDRVVDGWMNGLMDGWIDRKMEYRRWWIGGRIDRWIGERMVRWTEKSMDGAEYSVC